ncbi:hypothetical protein JYU34_008348 [Plutella xylostella]|uniref:FP protein N-terminal domain-containing protein n=1 Tax=Plutella xylostella TaxID=51655 RepID=A0ABQ7QPB6_PLUXY|nr:hypothetical protein JYU34_008348 [Plutella xylostella]
MQCKKCNRFPSKKDELFHCKGSCGGIFHRACIQDPANSARTGHCGACASPRTPTNVKAFFDLDPKNHKETLDALKTTNNRLQDLKNRCVHLETTNEALETRVRHLEQAERGKNVEIVGLEQRDNENIKEVIGLVAKKLEVSMSEVERAWRLRSNQAKPGAAKLPANIIVKLRNEAAQEEWIKNRRKIRSNLDIYPDSSTSPIYIINEDLTKYNRELLWQAKQKAASDSQLSDLVGSKSCIAMQDFKVSKNTNE